MVKLLVDLLGAITGPWSEVHHRVTEPRACIWATYSTGAFPILPSISWHFAIRQLLVEMCKETQQSVNKGSEEERCKPANINGNDAWQGKNLALNMFYEEGNKHSTGDKHCIYMYCKQSVCLFTRAPHGMPYSSVTLDVAKGLFTRHHIKLQIEKAYRFTSLSSLFTVFPIYLVTQWETSRPDWRRTNVTGCQHSPPSTGGFLDRTIWISDPNHRMTKMWDVMTRARGDTSTSLPPFNYPGHNQSSGRLLEGGGKEEVMSYFIKGLVTKGTDGNLDVYWQQARRHMFTSSCGSLMGTQLHQVFWRPSV